MYFSSSIQCYSDPRRIDSLMHCRVDYGFSMDGYTCTSELE